MLISLVTFSIPFKLDKDGFWPLAIWSFTVFNPLIAVSNLVLMLCNCAIASFSELPGVILSSLTKNSVKVFDVEDKLDSLFA